MLVNDLLTGFFAHLPGGSRRDLIRTEPVKIVAGGNGLNVSHRVIALGRRDVTAFQGSDEMIHFPLSGIGQCLLDGGCGLLRMGVDHGLRHIIQCIAVWGASERMKSLWHQGGFHFKQVMLQLMEQIAVDHQLSVRTHVTVGQHVLIMIMGFSGMAMIRQKIPAFSDVGMDVIAGRVKVHVDTGFMDAIFDQCQLLSGAVAAHGGGPMVGIDHLQQFGVFVVKAGILQRGMR